MLSAQSQRTPYMHMHMQVLSQVPTSLLSRSQKVCSPGPNRSALPVPTGLLSRSQQVCSRGPNRSHHEVPTSADRSPLQVPKQFVSNAYAFL